MKRLIYKDCKIKFDVRKGLIINYYMWIELFVWCFMTYSSIYHGKIFDYKNTETKEFVLHLQAGAGSESGNWYYRLMFGYLNLTNIDFEDQRSVQEKCDTLNTLFVFVFGLYFILAIFFLLGMSKMLGTKCLLCPYVTYDLSVIASVVVFIIYGAFKHIDILDRNGSFFVFVKLIPSSMILFYYRELKE